MDLQELKSRTLRCRAAVEGAMYGEGLKTGADAAALLEDRIVRKGQKATGGTFSNYSTKGVPAFLLFGSSRNAGAENTIRAKAKAGVLVSSRDFRVINGLGTLKNFQFTGQMWQEFGIKEVRLIRPGVVVIVLGGKSERTARLLAIHSKREGVKLTDSSTTEKKLIASGVQSRLIQIIKQNF